MTTWVVEHGFYGCESGCCGWEACSGNERHFLFEHPAATKPTDDEIREFARAMFEAIQPDDAIEIGEWRTCFLDD